MFAPCQRLRLKPTQAMIDIDWCRNSIANRAPERNDLLLCKKFDLTIRMLNRIKIDIRICKIAKRKNANVLKKNIRNQEKNIKEIQGIFSLVSS